MMVNVLSLLLFFVLFNKKKVFIDKELNREEKLRQNERSIHKLYLHID